MNPSGSAADYAATGGEIGQELSAPAQLRSLSYPPAPGSDPRRCKTWRT